MNIPITRKQGMIIASFAVIIIGLAGGTLWLYGKKDDQMQASQQGDRSSEIETQTMLNTADEPAESSAPKANTTAPTPPPTTASEPDVSQPGTYQAYSSSAVSDAGARSRVLFFHAPWCPQCRQLEADIESRGVPDGIAIFKIDYDSNQSLRQQYGVTQQTTVVSVDAEGGKIKSFLPYSEPTLANALSGLGL